VSISEGSGKGIENDNEANISGDLEVLLSFLSQISFMPGAPYQTYSVWWLLI